MRPGCHQPAQHPAPPRPPGKVGKTGGLLKEVPCFVSKGQHSKRGKLEVHTRRPLRTLDCRRRRGATTRPGEAGRSKPASLRSPPSRRRPPPPARPAPRRPLAGSARPDRGRAPAGGSPAASPGRLFHHHRPACASLPAEAASSGCPKAAAPSRRRRSPGPFSKGVRLGVSPRPRAAALPWLRLRINSPASGHPPASHSSFHPPSPSASASMPLQLSRGRFPRAPRLSAAQPPPKAQAPSSPPSAAAARALGSGPGRLASGVASGRAGPATPRGQLSAVLCVRAASPSAERLPRRRLARKREGEEERGTTRGLEGVKDDSTHSGKVPAWCWLWAASRSRPYPGFPAPPGPGQRGTGEERSHGDRVGNGASGAAGKGVKHCFGFAKEI